MKISVRARRLRAVAWLSMVAAAGWPVSALSSEPTEITVAPPTLHYLRCSTSGQWSMEQRPAGQAPAGVLSDPTSGLRGTFGCPHGSTTQVTHSDADFGGGQFIVQAGFEEGEIAAHTYTLTAGEFPIQIDTMEAIFAQQAATVQTTTHWSVLVWEGTPETGNLVATFSSDDVILPHLVLPPGTQGANLLVQVDPGDPGQIVVNDNGSHMFSVGYRVDQLNVPGSPCLAAPPSNQNAFPTTDTGGLQHATQNWLFAVAGTLCICSPGAWATFAELPGSPGTLCTPSGDWNIRASYCSLGGTQVGACCDPDGMCLNDVDDATCQGLGGEFQGDNTDCGSVTCPEPEGACCILGGCLESTLDVCTNGGGFYAGNNTPCPDACVTGACCFGDGSCQEVVEGECVQLGGSFSGAETTCDPNMCPQPTGACCTSVGCFPNQEEANCLSLNPPGEWQGPDTTCDPDPCVSQNPPCEATDVNCDGSTNAVDLGVVRAVANFNKPVGPAPPDGALDPRADVDGNGTVNSVDIGVIRAIANFNTSTGPCVCP